MPNFTAENSIYKSRRRYGMAPVSDFQSASANIQPASIKDYSDLCNSWADAADAACSSGNGAICVALVSAWLHGGCQDVPDVGPYV
jgi:hypothetical protein